MKQTRRGFVAMMGAFGVVGLAPPIKIEEKKEIPIEELMEGSGAEHTGWTDADRLSDAMLDSDVYEVVPPLAIHEFGHEVLHRPRIPLPKITGMFTVDYPLAPIFTRAFNEDRGLLLEMAGRNWVGHIEEIRTNAKDRPKLLVTMRDMTGQELPDDLVEGAGQYMTDGAL